MSNWYQGKISFQKPNEKGISTKITEVHLVDAVSYTDAEARMYEELATNIPDFQLVGLSKMKIHEVFMNEGNFEAWYKVKVNFVSFDEKSQKEKLTPFTMLINADTLLMAYNLIIEKLGTIEDYHITDISVTNILEVFIAEKSEE